MRSPPQKKTDLNTSIKDSFKHGAYVNSYLVLVRPDGKMLIGTSERSWEDIRVTTRVIELNMKIKVNSVSLSRPVVDPKISQVICYVGGQGITTREVGMRKCEPYSYGSVSWRVVKRIDCLR